MKSLILLCRSLSTLLDSGVELQKAFKLAAGKTADPKVHKVMQEVSSSIAEGADVTSALREQHPYFPELLVDMAHVAEQTGTLPEILASMAEHYENLLRLRKSFISQITMPVLQLVMAVFIIAFLIYILGWIAESQGGQAIDVLGWGLTGEAGAMTWLLSVFGFAAALFIIFKLVSNSVLGARLLDPFILNIPVVGQCVRDFAIARFSWAFALTQQSGMPINRSLRSSLDATGNGAFRKQYQNIWGRVQDGESLGDALTATQLFPRDYLEMVYVAETSGTVPEMLHRLSPQFEDQARRSLGALASAIGYLVWVIVAGFIIFVVFSIFMWYISLINSAAKEALGR